MYDFTGCDCPICSKALREGDDLVVCPACGAPYHRGCYLAHGSCLYTAKHAEGFEWQPPHAARQPDELVCANCGAHNDPINNYCKNCGVPLKSAADASHGFARGGQSAGTRGAGSSSAQYRYAAAGAQADASPYDATGYTPAIDPNELMDGIPAAEWVSYIGPSSRVYLNVFHRMELLNKKISLSFSALLFGPLYFFYRKAWKPAIAFSAVSVLLSVPAFLLMMILSGSSYAAGLNQSVVMDLCTVASVLSFVYKVVCGMFGFYLYKKDSAARIQRIRESFSDPEKRSYVLSAQGGTSVGAVIAAVAALYVLGLAASGLLGPDLAAVMNALL